MLPSKIRQICRYVGYALVTNIIYGFILYSVFTWLAGYSLLYAYLWNLALIILGLALDEIMYRMYQSENFAAQIKKEKDVEKAYRLIQWQLDNFVSFKTVLYLFYIVILVVSQIIESNPELIGESLGRFIHANNYSILVLIAFDTLIGQFSKDRERMKETSEKLKKKLL